MLISDVFKDNIYLLGGGKQKCVMKDHPMYLNSLFLYHPFMLLPLEEDVKRLLDHVPFLTEMPKFQCTVRFNIPRDVLNYRMFSCMWHTKKKCDSTQQTSSWCTTILCPIDKQNVGVSQSRKSCSALDSSS